MYSKLINNTTYNHGLQSIVSEIKQFLDIDLCAIKPDNMAPFFTRDIINMLTTLKTDDTLKSVIRDIILETCKNTKAAGGDNKIVIQFMINYITELLKHNTLSQYNKTKQTNIDAIKNLINQHRIYPQFNTLRKNMHKQFNQQIADIILEAYKLAGLTGKICIDKKNIPEPQLELLRGNIFDLNVNQQFLNNNMWDHKNVKCLIVEGIIENIHEIHRILEVISETKEPLIIFATGFSDDVLSTLYVNKKRETLNTLPIRVIQSIENINTLKDLSVVCNCNLISSLQGQALTSISYDDLGSIEHIMCSNNTVIIQNSNESLVANHLQDLIKRRSDNTLLDVQDLYDKRIKTMVSNYVQISVPNNVKYEEEEILENITNGVYTLKTLMSRGFINIHDIFNSSANKYYDDAVYKAIMSLGIKTMSANTLLSILNYGIVNSDLLMSTNGALIVDD